MLLLLALALVSPPTHTHLYIHIHTIVYRVPSLTLAIARPRHVHTILNAQFVFVSPIVLVYYITWPWSAGKSLFQPDPHIPIPTPLLAKPSSEKKFSAKIFWRDFLFFILNLCFYYMRLGPWVSCPSEQPALLVPSLII